jgi:Rrf2 family protein
MVDLAQHDEDGPVQCHKIAQRQDISVSYLEQLFVRLRKAGLVESVRGPGGGYRLARQPDRIRAGDVIRAVEGPIALAPCLENPLRPGCPRVAKCLTRQLWQDITVQIVETLDAVTLADLCQ